MLKNEFPYNDRLFRDTNSAEDFRIASMLLTFFSSRKQFERSNSLTTSNFEIIRQNASQPSAVSVVFIANTNFYTEWAI